MNGIGTSSQRATHSSLLSSRSGLVVRLQDFLELTKPRISILVLVTVVVAGIVARWGQPDILPLLHAILGTTLVVELSDDANGFVIADAIRIERIGDVVIEPEIEVLDGSTDISDGGTVSFGSTAPNVGVDKQLTVRNSGTGNLTLTPLSAGSLPSGYSLVANFGSTNLAPRMAMMPTSNIAINTLTCPLMAPELTD